MSTARPSTPLAGLRWLAQAALVLVAMGLAALAGLALSVVGAAPVAFLLVVGLAALVWSPKVGGSLSIALITAALATGATAAQLSEDRVDPSVGQLTLAPTRASELDGQSYRRGAGSIFVDLRKSQFTPGQKLRLKLRSDGGRIVVALPKRQCVAVDLKAQSGINEGYGGDLLGSLGTAGIDSANERWAWTYPDERADPFATEREGRLANASASQHGMRGAIWWPAGHGVGLFGQTLGWSLLTDGQDKIESPSELRGVLLPDPSALAIRDHRAVDANPRSPIELKLDATAAAAIIVRDFPSDVGPMSTMTGIEGEGDMSWPRTIRPPVSPEQMQTSLAWRENWNANPAARRAHRAWKGWERAVTESLHRKAMLAAGPCAPRDLRQAQWESVRYGMLDGLPEPEAGGDHATGELNAGRAVRVLAVNALGEVVVRGEPGTQPANGSPQQIVRDASAQPLRLLTRAEAAQRLIQLDTVRTPEVIR